MIFCTPPTYGAVAGGYPASDQPNTGGAFITDYSNAIKKTCELYGVPICDLTQNSQFRPSVEGSSQRVYTTDGVHFSTLGVEIISFLLVKSINNLL